MAESQLAYVAPGHQLPQSTAAGSFAVVVSPNHGVHVAASSLRLCKLISKNALAQVFGIWARAGWILGSSDFDTSFFRASEAPSEFFFVVCRCVSSEDANSLVANLAALSSLGLTASKVPTEDAFAFSARREGAVPAALTGWVVVVAPRAADLESARGSFRAWAAGPEVSQEGPTVMEALIKALGEADPARGHSRYFTFPERGFASPQVLSRTLVLGLDMADRLRASGEQSTAGDSSTWPPLAFDLSEAEALALVARLEASGFAAACFPAADSVKAAFSAAVSAASFRVKEGSAVASRTISSERARTAADSAVESRQVEDTLSLYQSDVEAAGRARGHRGEWLDSRRGASWCCLRQDRNTSSLVVCTHSPGTEVARPHWSCCGEGVAEPCSVWRGEAHAHPWHAHPVVACSHALSNFNGWRCDGAAASAQASGTAGGTCLGADRPPARRHPRGQRYRCPLPNCDFDLCECCFEGGLGRELPEFPSGESAANTAIARAAGVVSFSDEMLTTLPVRSLVALLTRAGLGRGDIIEREDLVNRAREAVGLIRDELARPLSSASRRPPLSPTALVTTPTTANTAPLATTAPEVYTCEHCGGSFRRFFGAYGYVRPGGFNWHVGASTNPADRPMSPNGRWCCAACEALATGVDEGEASSNFEVESFPESIGEMLSALATLTSSGVEGGGEVQLATVLGGLLESGQSLVFNVRTPGGLVNFQHAVSAEQLQQFIGGGGNILRGVGNSEIAALPQITLSEDGDEELVDEDVLPAPGMQVRVGLARFRRLGQDICAVCQEQFAQGDVVTTLASCRMARCRAFFHHGGDGACGGGLVKWLTDHTTCPLCRSKVPPRNNDNPENNRSDGVDGEMMEDDSANDSAMASSETPAPPCFSCGSSVHPCTCPGAERARGVLQQHRAFFLTVAAHVVRRVGLGESVPIEADERILASDQATNLERGGWVVRAPIRRLLEWSRRCRVARRDYGSADTSEAEGYEGAAIETHAAARAIPDASALCATGTDPSSAELVAWTVHDVRDALSSGQGVCHALVEAAEEAAPELVSDHERSMTEHASVCKALAGAEFTSLADDVAELVSTGGTRAQWAVADARLGRLEGSGFLGLRSAVALLRDGVRDATTIVESEENSLGATLRRYLLRVVQAREGEPHHSGLLEASNDQAAPEVTVAHDAGQIDGRENVFRPPSPLHRQQSTASRLRAAVATILPGSLGGNDDASATDDCNNEKERCLQCLNRLAAIAARLRQDPCNLSARRLRVADPLFSSEVLSFPGAVQVLHLLGFVEEISVTDRSVNNNENNAGPYLVLRTVDLDLLARLEGIIASASSAL